MLSSALLTICSNLIVRVLETPSVTSQSTADTASLEGRKEARRSRSDAIDWCNHANMSPLYLRL